MSALMPEITVDDRHMLLGGWTPADYAMRKSLLMRKWAIQKPEANPRTGYPDIELTDAGRAALGRH